jgi:hypothetical protein
MGGLISEGVGEMRGVRPVGKHGAVCTLSHVCHVKPLLPSLASSSSCACPQVLAALPDHMPLHMASHTLTAMLAGVMHRNRHTQVRAAGFFSFFSECYITAALALSPRCSLHLCRPSPTSFFSPILPASRAPLLALPLVHPPPSLHSSSSSPSSSQVLRGLQRARNISTRAELADISSQRVAIGEETTCMGCHRLILDNVVFGLPSGMLLCARCMSPKGG